MTSRLHIVTPCTRIKNIVSILRSIIDGKSGIDVEVRWWIVFDLTVESIPEPSLWKVVEFVTPVCHYTRDKGIFYGGPQRSRALDLIQDGYVTFVDDDTIVHPDYFRRVVPHLDRGVGGLLYGQELRREFWDGRPDGLKWFDLKDPLSDFEYAQMTVRRDVIGDVRHEGGYDNDKKFGRKVYRQDIFTILPHTLSYYNWIR